MNCRRTGQLQSSCPSTADRPTRQHGIAGHNQTKYHTEYTDTGTKTTSTLVSLATRLQLGLRYVVTVAVLSAMLTVARKVVDPSALVWHAPSAAYTVTFSTLLHHGLAKSSTATYGLSEPNTLAE